jgi:hypothetical protein
MALRQFKRRRTQRRGPNRLLSDEGWPLLGIFVAAVAVALAVFGAFKIRGAAGLLNAHRRAARGRPIAGRIWPNGRQRSTATSKSGARRRPD